MDNLPQNNQKSFLSSLTAKIILALIIFAGSAIIIISGTKFITEYYCKTSNSNKIIKQVKQTEQEKNQTDTSDLSSKASATGDWQTYQNKEYGFEFKYPKELILQKDDTIYKMMGFSNGQVYYYNLLKNSKKFINIKVTDLNKNKFNKKEKANYDEMFDFVNNFNSNMRCDQREICEVIKEKGYTKIINDNSVSFFTNEYEIIVEWELTLENKQIFDQILSTFKFTN